MKQTTAPIVTPSPKRGDSRSTTGVDSDKSQTFIFVNAALDMSWRLALVVLIPVIGGAELDKATGTSYVFTLIGLVLAVIGSGLVMRQAMRAANRLPVPKLTAVQKRAIKKAYDEEDDD